MSDANKDKPNQGQETKAVTLTEGATHLFLVKQGGSKK